MTITIIITLAILAILSIFILGVEDNDESAPFGIVPIIVIVAFTIIIILNINNYKEGQIDAVTGKLNYHLVTHPDSTKTWEKIQEDKR